MKRKLHPREAFSSPAPIFQEAFGGAFLHKATCRWAERCRGGTRREWGVPLFSNYKKVIQNITRESLKRRMESDMIEIHPEARPIGTRTREGFSPTSPSISERLPGVPRARPIGA